MSNRRTHKQIILQLLRSTNGGPVSINIIRGMLWRSIEEEPDDWVYAVGHEVCLVRTTLHIGIKHIKCFGFTGYQLTEVYQ